MVLLTSNLFQDPNFLMVFLWIGVFILALVIELCTEELISLWFAIAAAILVPISLLRCPYYFQVLIFAILSLTLLFTLRKLIKKKLEVKSITTNSDSLINKEMIILKDMINKESEGIFQDSDVVWSIRPLSSEDENLKKGDIVICKEIKGNHIIVSKK